MKGFVHLADILTKEGFIMARCFYDENPHPVLAKRAKKLLHDINHFREDCFYAGDMFACSISSLAIFDRLLMTLKFIINSGILARINHKTCGRLSQLPCFAWKGGACLYGVLTQKAQHTYEY